MTYPQDVGLGANFLKVIEKIPQVRVYFNLHDDIRGKRHNKSIILPIA